MTDDPTTMINSKGIRALIWIYFFLLMFEGPLRKWILPDLSDPLLLVRDPFLLMIYILALSHNIFPFNGYIVGAMFLGMLATVIGITVGSQNALVTAYGFDSLFFHLPLIFILPRVMNQVDVVSIGRWLLLLSFPMAILMVLQFRSPPDAFINCGAGGGLGSQMGGAFGRIRPPGFFTFITGAAQFLALASVFVIFGFWKKGSFHWLLVFGSGIAIAISAVVSTSRLTLGAIGLVLVMVGVIVFYNRKGVNNVVGMLIPIGVILVVVTNLDVFHEGREVFEARLKETGDFGAGVVGTATNWTARVFGDFYGGIEAMHRAPLLGAGLGVGTNVGARVLSGHFGFLLAEGEWARVVLELGPILAIPYLLIRVLICGTLYSTAARSARADNALPMLLFGSCALLMLTGQFSQTSTLGFAVFGSGLCLAAANAPGYSEGGEAAKPHQQSLTVKPRGRSPYAEALHRNDPSGLV